MSQYVKNKDLYNEVVKSKKQNKPTDLLVKQMMLIADNLAKKGNFSGYSYIDDMKSHAYIHMWLGWDKFNPKYPNAFAYFTQIAKNAFIQYINKEKQHHSMKEQMRIDIGLMPTYNNQGHHGDE